MRLVERVAVVVGGASGMGEAVCRRLAHEGAHVFVADIDVSKAEEVAQGIASDGGKAAAVSVDATDETSLRELFGKVDAEFGRLDIFHSQVGVPGPPGIEISDQDWQQNLDLNVKSAFYGATLAMPLLQRAQHGGSITLMASVSALVGSPYSPLYSLTKGAVVSFTRALALVGAPDDIRVNVVCPGPVDTPMLPRFFGREDGSNVDDVLEGFVSQIPMKRLATPAEIAGVVAFLASDDAGFVTGVAIPVDGGITAK
jgi:NAD(P)-dependent dehydrogenase (short-subunit alcohol dehydrogenase family)